MKSLTNPLINIRMAVADIAEELKIDQKEILADLVIRLEDSFLNRQNESPIYFLSPDMHRIPHTIAKTFLHQCGCDPSAWWTPIEGALDTFNVPAPESVPFERFSLRYSDIAMLLEYLINVEHMKPLIKKWQYGRPYNPDRFAERGRGAQKRRTAERNARIQKEASRIHEDRSSRGEPCTKNVIAAELQKLEEFCGESEATLLKNFRIGRRTRR